jgi:hypothetical protein
MLACGLTSNAITRLDVYLRRDAIHEATVCERMRYSTMSALPPKADIVQRRDVR